MKGFEEQTKPTEEGTGGGKDSQEGRAILLEWCPDSAEELPVL